MLIRHIPLWSRTGLIVAVTLWLANWAALYVEPNHGPFFLMVLGGFLISTWPSWTRLRD